MTNEPTLRKPLRLWPGVLIVAIQWLGRFVVPWLFPEALQVGVIGGLAGGVAIAVWWAFFSRAPHSERWGALALMIVALFATSRILDVSVATGMMGMMFPLYAVPVLSLAFVAWAVAGRHLADGPRRAAMVATILLACGGWALVRTGGFTADLDNDFAWRWSATPEDRLVAQGDDSPSVPAVPPPAPAAVKAPEVLPVPKADEAPTGPTTEVPSVASTVVAADQQPAPQVDEKPAVALPESAVAAEPVADWPGFRGPNRNGSSPGERIATDWAAAPPEELWRRPIGPGWSSFAVRGDLFYTQEQRGEDEVVSCYRVSTGEPVWKHRDAARFWESNGGAGPRGTPTLDRGRVYTLGATGILNALDSASGAVAWSRNAAADTGAKLPGWGFSGSPLVVDELVIVATSGQLAAYDLATGAPRWVGPAGGEGYSSPQLLTIGGVAQVLLLSGTGAISVAPADGTLLWEHPWKGYPIVQPALTADGDVLISVSSDSGTRRLAITPGPGGWTVEERWTSIGLKPYFNDFVVHEGHAYGFDGSILACIDLASGARRWKGGRYGNGQFVLLSDPDLLVVLSESGELALVSALPGQFTELARFKAIEGKTWNHPVVVGDVLLVRNSEEMVAFRLPLAGAP